MEGNGYMEGNGSVPPDRAPRQRCAGTDEAGGARHCQRSWWHVIYRMDRFGCSETTASTKSITARTAGVFRKSP